MSWKIVLNSDTIEYRIGDESFDTDEIKQVNRKLYNEAGGHQEPDDVVIEETYQADSEHGIFTWKVRARRSGFESYASIEEEVETIKPDPKIESDTPSFDVEHDE